jgi:SWI/SNF-related matrix-associated actin-dependent regulator of chromatin subfamily A3
VGNMLEVDAKLKASTGSLVNDCCTFNIGKSSEQLVLRFQDGTEFGHLNTHTSKALNELFDQPEIEFEAFGATRTILEAIGRSTKATDAVVRVNINVYGSKEAGKDVGRHLSENKVYLQRPDLQRPGSLYDNPHFLKFPDMQSSSFEYQTETAPGRVLTSNDSENFRKVVSNVYASLTRGAKLNRVEGDDRVKTPLLS